MKTQNSKASRFAMLATTALSATTLLAAPVHAQQALVGDGNDVIAGPDAAGNTVAIGDPLYPSFALGYKNEVGTAAPGAFGNLRAVGNGNRIDGINSLAIGSANTVNGKNAIAIGSESSAVGDDGSAATISGGNPVRTGNNTTAIGQQAIVNGENSTALGSTVSVTGNASTAIGSSASVTGYESFSFGSSSDVFGDQSIAIGTGADVFGDQSIAIGRDAEVFRDQSIAIGMNASVSHTQSTAIGFGAASTQDNQIVLGGTTNSSIIAKGVRDNDAGLTDEDEFVTIGLDGELHSTTLTVSGDGTGGTDGALVLDIQDGSITSNDLDLDDVGTALGGNTAAQNAMASGIANNTTAVSNLLTGMANNSSEASQTAFAGAIANNLTVVGSAGTPVSGGISIQPSSIGTQDIAPGAVTFDRLDAGVQNRITGLETGLRTANAGVSMAFAMSNLPQLSNPDSDGIFGIAVGAFEGETSLAMGGTVRLNNSTLLRGSVAYSNDTFGAGVGIGWEF